MSLKATLLKKWFLIALAVLITTGMSLGWHFGEQLSSLLTGISQLPRWITACVLFLMAFSLDSRLLRESFRSPAPVVMGFCLSFAAVPLAAWALMPLQTLDDFRYGLMIAGSVPCTLAAASVWTRKAKGNDAVSLLVTLATNTVCFVVTPFWLNLATDLPADVKLDTGAMVVRLFQAVLIPTLCGQGLRQFRGLGDLATKCKTQIGGAAQSMILLLVLYAALRAGTQLHHAGTGFGFSSVAIVWGSCIAIHVVVLSLGLWGSRVAGFPAASRSAVAFAGSQKTLPNGVLIATDPAMFGSFAFAVFPMLMYHASQLFIDTAVADRLAQAQELAESDPDNARPEEPS